MSALRRACVAFLLTFVITISFAQDDLSNDHTTLTPNGSSVTLDVYGGRPVSDAVYALEQRYGYIITYEDPEYVYSDDVIDETAAVRRDHRQAGPSVPRLMLPRGSGFLMQLPPSPCISPSEMTSILQQLLQLPASRGGRFRMEESKLGAIFHVIPTEARDRRGRWSEQVSPLDARISFPSVARSEDQLLATIVGAVSAAAHVSVNYNINGGTIIGPYPVSGAAPGFQYNIGADDETAREVLTRMLVARPDREMSWALLNAVEEGPTEYQLNIQDLGVSGCQASRPAAPPLPPPPSSPLPQGPGCINCAPATPAKPQAPPP
jgi:hypothetical protein